MAQVEEKLTVADVSDLFETEGLGYAIQSHTSFADIADAKLRSMWKRCAKLLNDIEAYVEENTEEDDQDAPESGFIELSADNMTVSEVAILFEVEGMHYVIQSHTSYKSVADPKLASMWKRATKLMNDIEAYVEQEEEPEPQLTSETVELGREHLLLDEAPKSIADAPKDGKYDEHLLVMKHGGQVRGYVGGRFGDMFELAFEGTFGRAELTSFMDTLTELSAWHMYQSVVCEDGTRFAFPQRENPEAD